MSPAAQQANPPADIAISDQLLQDGELIILSVKPSLWFVLQVSWPVLVAAALVAGGLAVLGSVAGGLDGEMVLWVCGGIAAGRLVAGGVQWFALRYVLTSRRIIRISLSWQAGVTELPLTCVQLASVIKSPGQRVAGVGNIAFAGESGMALPMNWLCLAEPDNVCAAVNEAIAKARR